MSRVKNQFREQPAQSPDPNLVPEFDYRIWNIKSDGTGDDPKEVAEFLNDASMHGWALQGKPQEAFHEDRVVVTILVARGKERKIIGPVGLA